MDASQAALAGRLLQADLVVPIHYDGFHVDGHYETRDDELGRFLDAAAPESYATATPLPGQTVEL